jgi:uracil-DNA glycosylase
MENNQQDYLQLLHNLLFALGFGKQQLSFEQFRWPVIKKMAVKTTAVDQSETAARQALEAFVCRQLTQSSSQTILLMGDVAANYFTESAWPQGKLSQYSPASCTLIRTVSAVAMLNNPALKRQAWHELQALAQHRRSQSSTDA